MSDESSNEIINRPGESALSYRATTYADSLARMLARVHAYPIAAGPNQGRRPLAALTTRASTDPAMALLDAWSVALDVVTFYQERLINEGYLRTSLEQRSVSELAQTIGYQPTPATSATTYLAYTVDTSKGMPESVTLPAGAKVMSVPSAGGLPQTFETSSSLTAYQSRNLLQPLLTQLQNVVTSSNAAAGTAVTSLLLSGVATGLSIGDLLLINGVSTVELTAVTVQAATKCTQITFRLLSGPAVRIAPTPQSPPFATSVKGLIQNFAVQDLANFLFTSNVADSDVSDVVTTRGLSTSELQTCLTARQATLSVPQNAMRFRLKSTFFGGDARSFATMAKFSSTYYYGTDPYSTSTSSWDDANGNNSRTIWVNSWGVVYSTLSSGCSVFLSSPQTGLVAGSTILLVSPLGYANATITKINDTVVSGYGRTDRTLGLVLGTRSDYAPPVITAGITVSGTPSDSFLTRDTVAYLKSELLTLCTTIPLLVEQPVGKTITLSTLVLGLTVGQPLMVSGERMDTGATVTEIAYVYDCRHVNGYTVLTFKDPLSYPYTLDSITINANVVAASHGETVVKEVLGSGDASQQNQRFALRQSPLTYLSASNEVGYASTLEIRVNGVLWREVSSLLDADDDTPAYVIVRDEKARATVLFGDGLHGSRLPSGTNNVVASYRIGSGLAGEVDAASLKLLLTKPVGIKSVQNPTAASGASAAASNDDIRIEIPKSLYTLGRAVSLSDYEAMADSYPGIAKAQATAVNLGGTAAVHLTVATDDGQPLLRSSTLYQNLMQTLLMLGDPTQPLLLDDYRRRNFRLRANLVVDQAYVAATVLAQAESALQAAFAFEKRSFAQSVHSAEILAVLQGVPGVVGALLNVLDYDFGTKNSATLTAASAYVDPKGRSQGAELLLLSLLDGDLGVMP